MNRIEEIYALYQAIPGRDRRHSRWVLPAAVLDEFIDTENERRRLERERTTRLAADLPGFTWDPQWYEPIPHPGYDNPGTLLGLPIRVADVVEIGIEIGRP